MRKYLFLDIDGVLNGYRPDWKGCPNVASDPFGFGMFCHDPVLVGNVKTLVEKHALHVVLSSAWRVYWKLEDVQEIWKCQGWDHPLVDKTPNLEKCIDWNRHKDGHLRFSETVLRNLSKAINSAVRFLLQ